MEITKIPEASANLNSNCKEISKNIDASNKLKPGNATKSRTCTFYYNYGFCKFGNNCKYKHFKKGTEKSKHASKDQKPSTPQNVPKNRQIENQDEVQNSDTQTISKEVCRYFKLGDCKKGDKCEYLHSVDLISSEMTSLSLSSLSQTIPRKVFSSSGRSSKKRTLCYYFKKGLCYKGDSCRYYHHSKSHFNKSDNLCNVNTENGSNSAILDKSIIYVNDNSTANRSSCNFRRTFNIFDLSSLTEDAVSELRATEISQLKKRFPRFEIITENQTYSILFQPSDPDWAFDVKKLKLEVEFPEKYPTERCKISVIRSAENIPLILIKHLNTAISQWIHRKFEENDAANKTELMFRSFLRWFDKSLEDLFVTGLRKVKQDIQAKEAGIEFVPVENLFSSPEKTYAEKCSENCSEKIAPNPLQPKDQTSTSDSKSSLSQISQNNKSAYYGGTNGMKIVFTNLELLEGAAALTCAKISVTLQCCRCKASFNMKSTPKKSNSHVCSKCSKNLGFTFEPSTVHQFSSVLGTLHLLDCLAVDINLVECHFLIDCLNCSKQVAVDGIHYGQKHKMWCTFCNEKLLMSIGSVKFQALKLASVPDSKYPLAKKVEKKTKDPVVKDGEPLPNFGACRHYKKSFRWLRFPCCGRLYACDECHNEKEVDHEMKYASRMICGFCAKEQPYTREKLCLFCSQSLTKKSCSHWEGGKGCRNKIQMSREDKQKYSGISKTVSKKAQINKPKKKH